MKNIRVVFFALLCFVLFLVSFSSVYAEEVGGEGDVERVAPEEPENLSPGSYDDFVPIVSQRPTLTADVMDSNANDVVVYFYDAETDNRLGYDVVDNLSADDPTGTAELGSFSNPWGSELEAGEEYSFYVVAVDEDDENDDLESNPSETMFFEVNPIVDVENIGVIDNREVTFDWEYYDSANIPQEEVQVEVFKDSSVVDDLVYDGGSTEFSEVLDVDDDEEYDFRLRGRDGFQYGEWTDSKEIVVDIILEGETLVDDEVVEDLVSVQEGSSTMLDSKVLEYSGLMNLEYDWSVGEAQITEGNENDSSLEVAWLSSGTYTVGLTIKEENSSEWSNEFEVEVGKTGTVGGVFPGDPDEHLVLFVVRDANDGRVLSGAEGVVTMDNEVYKEVVTDNDGKASFTVSGGDIGENFRADFELDDYENAVWEDTVDESMTVDIGMVSEEGEPAPELLTMEMIVWGMVFAIGFIMLVYVGFRYSSGGG